MVSQRQHDKSTFSCSTSSNTMLCFAERFEWTALYFSPKHSCSVCEVPTCASRPCQWFHKENIQISGHLWKNSPLWSSPACLWWPRIQKIKLQVTLSARSSSQPSGATNSCTVCFDPPGDLEDLTLHFNNVPAELIDINCPSFSSSHWQRQETFLVEQRCECSRHRVVIGSQ